MTLMELVAVVSILAVGVVMLVPSYINRLNHARYEKTVKELTALDEASVNYFIIYGLWPQSVDLLVPAFMPRTLGISPFDTPYQISAENSVVTAFVQIPAGIARADGQGSFLVITHQGSQDQIAVSQTVKNTLTGRLNYQMKYGSG